MYVLIYVTRISCKSGKFVFKRALEIVIDKLYGFSCFIPYLQLSVVPRLVKRAVDRRVVRILCSRHGRTRPRTLLTVVVVGRAGLSN